VHRAFFIVRLPRMSLGRVMEEWDHLTAVLRPDISRRLGIVAVAPDDVVVIPNDPETQGIAEHVRKIAADFRDDVRTEGGLIWSRKSYEIWKVLLGAWLARERALPLHELQRRSGASYPSVSSVLDRLEMLGELERGSNRSAALTGLPRRSLGEVLALGEGLRETLRFVDRSGRPPNATDLIRRIKAKAPDVALGGVEAARHYMPHFNLNGYPRVDVTVGEKAEPGWMKRVDPALGEAETPDTSGVRLVVHRLRRPEPDFTRTPNGLFADRAEVLLDLHELRLGEQADEFVDAMREQRNP
jgi:hypothetical protein